MEKIKNFFNLDIRISLLISFVLAFWLNFAIEAMARQSFMNGLSFLIGSPLVFFYNVLIIFTTLTITIFIRRRLFLYAVLCTLWVALGLTNGIILSNRMTPFTTKDLAILEDGISILPNYLSTQQMTYAGIGAALFLAIFVILFIKGHRVKSKIAYKKYLLIFVMILALLVGMTGLSLKAGIVDTFFGNLAYAYRDYGVPYCFLNTWLNTGVSKPIGYTKAKVEAIFDEGELSWLTGSEENTEENSQEQKQAKAGTKKDDSPNIIVVQLESFIDPLQVKTVDFSDDPIPNFRELLKNNPSGFLTVPSVGAGTANTEFEVLCGMSVKFFGPGEYPYKAILREKTCESAAYTLKNRGYETHAIHNHRGAFYGRNEVFANLGFDTFTSLEYMNNVIKTPRNWAKDAVLSEQIFAALNSSEGSDFIFTVSVQGHGKYPSKKLIKNPTITVENAPSEELRWQYEYYANQIYEMDQWIGKLTRRLANHEEKTILVLYGDHLPALEMTAEEMESGDLYATQYVIWSNYNIERGYGTKPKNVDEEKIGIDLKSYQLIAKTFEMIGINEGTMTVFHQNHSDSPTYYGDLRTLEYDMLYGKQYIYGGSTPFERTNMKMGINPISIEEIVKIADKYYIKGQNFTQYSKISLDGKILNTMYLGPTVLGLLEEVDPEEVVNMKISQVEKNKEILSTTE